jgi:uridylate kinase
VAKVSTSEADWVGIMATRLNAQLVIAVLGDLAHPEVISDPDTRLKSRAAVLVAAGCQPGNSTDYIAVRLARTYKARQVVNLTNIDYVYDRDPRFDKNAKGFRKMTWRQFRQLAGDKWQPGLSLPFDPLASSLAESLKMEVVIINGAKLPNLSRCLDGQTFTGTVINI